MHSVLLVAIIYFHCCRLLFLMDWVFLLVGDSGRFKVGAKGDIAINAVVANEIFLLDLQRLFCGDDVFFDGKVLSVRLLGIGHFRNGIIEKRSIYDKHQANHGSELQKHSFLITLFAFLRLVLLDCHS